MTRKQIYAQIATFLGKDWGKAREFEKIFYDNCCMPPSQITNLQLAFGKYSRCEGNEVIYYGENRNTLHFTYTGEKACDKFCFSILR